MPRFSRTSRLAAFVSLASFGALECASLEALADPPKPPAKPAETKPAEPKTLPKAETKPAETKPEDKPAETKPEDKPAETKPADPDKPKATGIDEARKRMEAGQSEFAKGEYAKATAEFESAYEALPNVAFLFNAAFAAEKAGDRQRAIAQYEKYLVGDPTTPERATIEETIARLRKELTESSDTAKPDAGDKAAKPADEKSLNEIRSLVEIESDPAGAPVTIYERLDPTAPEFKPGQKNDGWKKVVENIRTPKGVPLKVGHYYAVIEAFQDYKRSGTPVDVTPGQVVIFKANLSQGEFLGYLRVKSNVEGAKVFLDDPDRKLAPWARTPQGGTVNDGKHEVLVTAPGYKPFNKKDIEVRHGQQSEVTATLDRVDHGYLVLKGNIDIPEVAVDAQEKDGYQRRSKAEYKVRLPAGKHTLVLDADDRKTLRTEIEIPRGQELPVTAELKASYPRGKAVALGILAAAAGGGGGVLYWQAKERKKDPDPAKRNDDLQKIFQYGSYGTWGLGGLFLGLSIFYSVYDPLPDSELTTDKPREFPEDEAEAAEKAAKQAARAFVLPVFDANSAGLSVVGTF
ncbi:MAG: PEGA domain-containing protein [Deltaproteobacteria bacterium]|nr:PEGA domain-containing protein [Deltaproteobacteria bacterium]